MEMAMHYTSVTDPVIFVDNCTETVTEDGKLILHLTFIHSFICGILEGFLK